MLLNRIFSLFPVIQHQATTEAFDLVIDTSVIKNQHEQDSFLRQEHRWEKLNMYTEYAAEYQDVVEFIWKVCHFLFVANCPIWQDCAVFHHTLNFSIRGIWDKSLGGSFVHEWFLLFDSKNPLHEIFLLFTLDFFLPLKKNQMIGSYLHKIHYTFFTGFTSEFTLR